MSDLPTIRPAEPRDQAKLLALWIELVEHHRRLDPDYPTPRGLPALLGRELARGLRSESCRLLVAEAQDAIVGFLFAELDGPDARANGRRNGVIQEIYVEPTWRRRGLASELLVHAEAWLRERHARRVALRVERANRLGLRFWRRSGFEERARILEREL